MPTPWLSCFWPGQICIVMTVDLSFRILLIILQRPTAPSNRKVCPITKSDNISVPAACPPIYSLLILLVQSYKLPARRRRPSHYVVSKVQLCETSGDLWPLTLACGGLKVGKWKFYRYIHCIWNSLQVKAHGLLCNICLVDKRNTPVSEFSYFGFKIINTLHLSYVWV